MPVRSLRSSVLRWPDRETVHRAAVDWAARLANSREDVSRVGYFGSYARGDWGIGSDLDIVVILKDSRVPFGERSLGQDVLSLPVGVDLIIYTADEWQTLVKRDAKFYREVMGEVVWIYEDQQC